MTKVKNLRGRHQKHKEGNTFKFKSFNARVAEVSVDLRTQLRGSTWKPSGDECFFMEAFTKWTDLNRTQHFTDFQKDVRGKIQSYPLVVFHKDAIVQCLNDHLAVPDSLALEPLLDLVVNLVKDLQGDFYQFFPVLFQTFLERLVPSQDVEILEWTFACLSQLFRIQRRQMTKDWRTIFELMIPLFEEGNRDFIVRFATESFAFIIRDCKNHAEILDYLLAYCNPRLAPVQRKKSAISAEVDDSHDAVVDCQDGLPLEESGDSNFVHSSDRKSPQFLPDLAPAIGELLFETVKNVNHHLHSAFDKLYPVFLAKLREKEVDKNTDQDALESCVSSMTDFLLGHITRETSEKFWTVFLKVLDDRESSICRLHCLIFHKCVEAKKGWLIVDPGRTMAAFSSFVSSPQRHLDQKSSELLASSAASLLQCDHFDFDMKMAARIKLIKNVFLSLLTVESKFRFAGLLHELPLYQTEVLPSLLELALREYSNNLESVLVALVSLTMDLDSEQFSSANLVTWQPFRMDFGVQNGEKVGAFLRTILDAAANDNSDTVAGWTNIWALAVLTSHISPKAPFYVQNRVLSSLNTAIKMLERLDLDQRLILVVCQAVHALAVAAISTRIPTFDAAYVVAGLTPCLKNIATDVSLLSSLEVALSACDSSTPALPADVEKILRNNLRDKDHAVRRITLRILDRYHSSANNSSVEEKKSVYQICLFAELVEPSVHDYREKLRFLRMLDFSQLDRLDCDAAVPLLYLFGSLKIGFQLLWKEIKQLIASYRSVFVPDKLWPLVESELRLLSCEAELAAVEPKTDEARGALESLLDSHRYDLSRTDSNPLNAHKYRIHLWEAFAEVVGVDSARNRIFSELFQRFMKNEFVPATFLNSSSEEKDDDLEPGLGSTRKSRSEAEDTACAMLNLLSKLHNPQALHQDPAIRIHLFDLLTYRSEKVQSATLRLLFNYKLDYIRPYEEHLMKLLDENEIWNTMAEIEFGATDPVIQEVHRSRVVPLIIRILFGRMQAKNKSRNTDKAAPKGRTDAVVRALSNCRPEEFQLFLELALKPCSVLLSGTLEETVDRIKLGGKLPSVQLKLAAGVLQTLFAILDELRAGSDHCIHTILRAVIGILAVVGSERQSKMAMREAVEVEESPKNAAERDDDDQERPVANTARPDGLLKKLRKECYRCLAKMCSIFPVSTFSEIERGILLDVAVWPEADSVARDGPFTVVPLMRLALVWSQNCSYHDLLAVKTPSQTKSPLGMLVDILNPDLNAASPSINLTVEVLDHLLLPENLMDTVEAAPKENVAWSFEQRKSILAPFAGDILRYFHHKLSLYLLKKKRKSSPLTETELRIASGMSELSLDPVHSLAILDLLVPLLLTSDIKKATDVLGILGIVQRLIAQVPVDALTDKIVALVPLMSKDFSRDARNLLGMIFNDIARRVQTDSLITLADTVSDLLAWDKRLFEEPDYERRGDGYKKAKRQILEKPETSFALLLLHIADFDIRQASSSDSALRGMALDCMLLVIRRLSGTPDSGVILTHLTPLLKSGLKNPSEAVRSAYIAVFGEIVDFYPNHALYRELVFLHYPASKKAVNSEKCKHCNSEGIIAGKSSNDAQIGAPKPRCRCYDKETDVFDNLRHLQKHRVGEALHDLARWTKDKTIPVSTVHQYFLPFATAHLCNDAYISEKHQGLINAVIELVHAVCFQLTWAKYEPMLKHFLNLMTRKSVYQRQLIRVVVAVVDAFHFDLSGVNLRNFRVQKAKTTQPETEPDPAMGEMVDEEELEQQAEPDPVVMEAVVAPETGTLGVVKAEKIYRSLTQFMIPGLTKLITDKAENDSNHKLSADIHAGEKEEILRAPVALAIVKLLQKLPLSILRRQIPGVFLKIARMLKSRLLSIRQSTRETLGEIMLSLGPSYLPTLIKELRGVLKRGYQIHVLVHCVHMILTKLLPMLQSGSLDRCVVDLVQICHEEMFGELAEEKEVTALTRKIAEAKSIKSYDTYAILASFASPGVLVRMIKPLKEKAEETQSRKVAVKLEKAFRQILTGLSKNAQLTEKDLLLFSYALYDQSTGIFGGLKQKKDDKTAGQITRPDSYLITPEPGRSGPAPVTSRSTNDYLVQDFGLQILLSCFKNNRLRTDQDEHIAMLDPFVAVVVPCLTARDMPVKTSALRCLIWMLKFKLPSLETGMEGVIKTLFVHLKNYSGPGAAVAENAEFVNAVYRALSSAVRDASDVKISNKHLKVLLTYAESDFREGSKQILAFNLLKALLSRNVPPSLSAELCDTMLNLAKTSIQGEEENLRQQSRHLVSLYLTKTTDPTGVISSPYSSKRKWRVVKGNDFVNLFIDNLEYSMEHGRMICLTVLGDLLEKLGPLFFKDYALQLFQLFAARLSDESSAVRHKAAESITAILHRAGDSPLAGDIFTWIERWLTDEDVPIRRIGFQTVSLLVQVEKAKFLPHLETVLSTLQKVIKTTSDMASSEEAMLEFDHLLINALSLLANIIDNCGSGIWSTPMATKTLSSIFNSVRDLLLHEHEWVRIRSLEVYWRVFQQQPSASLAENVLFIEGMPKKLAVLAGVLIHQLKSYSDREDYYTVWSKCMTYVAEAIATLPVDSTVTDEENADVKAETDAEDVEVVPVDRLISLPFVARGVCREAVYEALHEPKKTTKRLQVVKWIRGLCDVFSKATYVRFLPSVLQVLYRCSNEPSAQKDEVLKRLTEEVTVAVESHVGRDVYSDAMRAVIIRFSRKRADRKRQQAVEPILNPEKVARKKMKKHQTKKDVRKRKIHDLETGRLVKRARPR